MTRGRSRDAVTDLALVNARSHAAADSLYSTAYGSPPDYDEAAHAFAGAVEDAIVSGSDTVELDVSMAIILAMALSSRKRKRGRPQLSRLDRLVERAVVATARQRKFELMTKDNLGAGEAGCKAADEAATLAGRRGVNIAAPTILRRMADTDK